MLWKETGRDKRRGRGEDRKGGIMKERKRWRKREGGREPSCAKYLTLCADLPKVRFVLGAYSFSHAGVLLSALPAEGILIKKGALLPPFPLSLSLPSVKLKFPLPLLPSLFLVHPLHNRNRNATQQERVERQSERL